MFLLEKSRKRGSLTCTVKGLKRHERNGTPLVKYNSLNKSSWSIAFKKHSEKEIEPIE